MTQPSLLDDLTRRDKPWKRQRSTAREVYRERRKTDRALKAAGLETKEAKVLRCLAAHWNATQTSPTALELMGWMRNRRGSGVRRELGAPEAHGAGGRWPRGNRDEAQVSRVRVDRLHLARAGDWRVTCYLAVHTVLLGC